MKFRLACLALATAALAFAGCEKIKLPRLGKQTPPPTPTPATPAPAADPGAEIAEAAPAAPTPPPKPAAPTVDKNAQVIVLCYHRLEGKAGGIFSIEPALFEQHMEELKARGIAVISMQDFLAWRAGKKTIPPKSALITIDDGYVCSLNVAVPILKKYGYPATFFVYLDFIEKGGKSMTWAQLGQIRDAGFEIGSHTVMHQSLTGRKPAKGVGATNDEWVKHELEYSKQVIEEQLGIRVAAIAYPYGNNNPKVRELAQAAGYDLAFTTYGQRIGHGAAPFSIGRYDVTAKGPGGVDGFNLAISFQGPQAATGPSVAQDAQALMVTEPMNGAVTNNPRPLIKANLASLGALDPNSIKMRLSGLGIVPAQYEPGTQNISFVPPQPLRPGNVVVIISGTADGQAVETKWSFRIDPNAQPGEAAEPPLPPRR
jgi:peptidoglycan/xylan/chitin deacetylase (PgdA/CDA1 family)